MSKIAGKSRDCRLESRQVRVFISGEMAIATRMIITCKVSTIKAGGAYRDRTDDPLLAKQVLSQLS